MIELDLTYIAGLYSDIFTPEIFILICTLVIAGYEYKSPEQPSSPIPQFGVIIGAWLLSYLLFTLLVDIVQFNAVWIDDVAGSIALLIVFGLIWITWKHQEWGVYIPQFALLLISMTVMHILIVPIWDVSSHVSYAALPAGYLTYLYKQFRPLLVIPVLMIPSRQLIDAHTWAQSFGGIVLAGIFLAIFIWSRDNDTIQNISYLNR